MVQCYSDLLLCKSTTPTIKTCEYVIDTRVVLGGCRLFNDRCMYDGGVEPNSITFVEVGVGLSLEPLLDFLEGENSLALLSFLRVKKTFVKKLQSLEALLTIDNKEFVCVRVCSDPRGLMRR